MSRFRYDAEYLSRAYAPISISLLLQEQPFSPTQTKNFFEGLLPEGFTRRSVAQWMHVDENDYLSILHGLGRECLIDEISEASFRLAARDAGLGERMAVRRFDELRERFQTALHLSAEELSDTGYPLAQKIERGILQEGGIKHFIT